MMCTYSNLYGGCFVKNEGTGQPSAKNEATEYRRTSMRRNLVDTTFWAIHRCAAKVLARKYARHKPYTSLSQNYTREQILNRKLKRSLLTILVQNHFEAMDSKPNPASVRSRRRCSSRKTRIKKKNVFTIFPLGYTCKPRNTAKTLKTFRTSRFLTR